MRKKLLSCMMAAMLSISLLAGCGGKKEEEKTTPTPEITQSAEETPAPEDPAEEGDEESLEELIAKAKDAKVAAVSYTPELPTGSEEAEIFIEPIDGISDDFIRGVDISSVISEEESGVVYKDWDGNEKDLFQILADAGVNYIRVRVWNNPYDADGNGFGGGNCDVNKACEIGRRAAECGMKLLVDFHYSDFWADPAKQQAPYAWTRKNLETKIELTGEFTKEALAKIIAAGADVGMVQIGNEINKGICGVYETEGVMQILDSASKAVRYIASETGRDIKIAVHYTQIDDISGTMQKAARLKEYNIDYDIFGVSYYVYWHGSMDNMNQILKDIKAEYGVDTCVMETSYPYTGSDGDGFGNRIAAEDAIDGYPANVQGQAKILRDIMDYANDAGALGLFYWEPAWTPVGTDFESNQELWEKYGSGWASSYASFYDAQDAGVYYGGSSWDNQAMFSFDSVALPSLNVFKWLKYGATADLAVMSYPEIVLESGIGDEIVLPEKISPFYNDPSVSKELSVEWSKDDIAKVNVYVGDTYYVKGTVENGDVITATVKVLNINFLKNPGFDENDVSMWIIDDRGAGDTTDVQLKAADALSGEKSLHFYSGSEIDFDVYQTITIEEDGTYSAIGNIQGGEMGSNSDIYLYVNVDGTEYKSEPIEVAGWVVWKKAEITDIPVKAGQSVTVGMHVAGAAKGWGTMDDFEFFAPVEIPETTEPTEPAEPEAPEKPAAGSGNGDFTLYVYNSGSEPLYVDIWKWAGLEAADGTEYAEDPFGWGKNLPVMQAVDGKSGWYSLDLNILDAAAEDGFDVYAGSASNNILKTDNTWGNSPEIYSELVSGNGSAYAVKDWALTDLP